MSLLRDQQLNQIDSIDRSETIAQGAVCETPDIVKRIKKQHKM